MNWAVYVAVALLMLQWVGSVFVYRWVHGAWLKTRFAWAANGLLLFGWRARKWERPQSLLAYFMVQENGRAAAITNTYVLNHNSTTAGNYTIGNITSTWRHS